jgi:hypothetical protein
MNMEDSTFSIHDMPIEILLLIVENFDTKVEDYDECLVVKATLKAMCLTSRLFFQLAQPLLYRALEISFELELGDNPTLDPTTMLLHRTLEIPRTPSKTWQSWSSLQLGKC